jgi:hypothetical protein
MTRPAASRISTALAPEKQPAEKASDPSAEAPPAPPSSLAWRLTIGLWLTSFGFLFLYELLMMVVRLFSWKR